MKTCACAWQQWKQPSISHCMASDQPNNQKWYPPWGGHLSSVLVAFPACKKWFPHYQRDSWARTLAGAVFPVSCVSMTNACQHCVHGCLRRSERGSLTEGHSVGSNFNFFALFAFFNSVSLSVLIEQLAENSAHVTYAWIIVAILVPDTYILVLISKVDLMESSTVFFYDPVDLTWHDSSRNTTRIVLDKIKRLL